jgi:fumarylacetoacetate (FAA) hydrolase family protein
MTPTLSLDKSRCLPEDAHSALLLGRLWEDNAGPCLVLIRGDEALDVTALGPTMSQLLNREDLQSALQNFEATRSLGNLDDLLTNTERGVGTRFLAPCDLQSIKACGVTFVDSLLERVVEERALGDRNKARAIRQSIVDCIGPDIANVEPGSENAMKVKAVLQEQGMWSQYLEVGLGPDAEVFTKSQPMSAVGLGAELGLHPNSSWNNPEPELVLAVNCRGQIVGASLGNDVNLRDVEGRSALLLGQAKDNNASCVVGPFIRLFDETFSLDDARQIQVQLNIHGSDGFTLSASSEMQRISRDVEKLVAQVIGSHHQYPDGFVLFTGTMYAPIEDRFEEGGGFSHLGGDIVEIYTPKLGMLANRVGRCDEVSPWTFGIGSLMQNLAARGFL